MASFDRVIAISKTVEKYVNENYERHLKRPPRLIYRGSDEEYFSQKFVPSNTYLEDFFTKFPSLRDKKIISFPGRLSSWKGQESFIKLISDLPQEFSGLIVGPYESAKPKYLKNLKKLIEDYRLQNRIYFYNAKDDIREIYFLPEVVLNLSSKPEPCLLYTSPSPRDY